MSAIPKQLEENGLRFLLIAPKSKVPLELEWQKTNNYFLDNEKFNKHINGGGNYGVLCGEGLIVIDADTGALNKIVEEKLPKTFSVKTSKGKHYYYICNGFSQKKVLKSKKVNLIFC